VAVMTNTVMHDRQAMREDRVGSELVQPSLLVQSTIRCSFICSTHTFSVLSGHLDRFPAKTLWSNVRSCGVHGTRRGAGIVPAYTHLSDSMLLVNANRTGVF
jgi:hypothetical protein